MINLKNNTFFYIILLVVISLCSVISYENITFDLYFNSKYIDYSKYFLSLVTSSIYNLDSNKTAFPLWGYGIVHLLFKNKLNILVFQQLLSFYTIIKLDQYFRINQKKIILYFRLLILISFPYFLFHTQIWPKSISSSLLFLAILQLFYYLDSKKTKSVVYSGILFGILCNFRSDYLILSLTLPLFILLWEFIRKNEIDFYSLRVMLIPVSVFILLIPWGIYTFKNTGHYFLNSSNSGHVLFIGLGQLPNNIWKITPQDDDSIMRQTLIDKFKTTHPPPFVSYSENTFLVEKFSQMISQNPFEWLKKCLFAFRLLILDPFYVGNVGNFQKNGIANIKEIRALEKNIYNFNYEKSSSILFNTRWEFSSKEIFQIIFTIITKIIGFLIFISALISIFYGFIKYRFSIFNDIIFYLCFLIIGYQCAISIFAFHMPVYNTSIYLIYLIIISLSFNKLFFNQTENSN